LRALRNLSTEDLAMYPEYQAGVARLARWFRVRSVEMLLTNGADGAIQQIVNTFVEPGNVVLLADPTFVMYRFYVEMAGARIRTVRYDNEMGFSVRATLQELKKSPRIVFLANPNNPTGTLMKPADIARLVRAAPRTLIVVDEAYFEFSRVTVLPWIRKFPNLVVLRTFSKAAGLAGLRLGCLFAAPEAMSYLRKTSDPFPVNVAALAAAEATVKNHANLEKYASEIVRGREMLSEALTKLGVKVFPSAANFVLADFGPLALKIIDRLGAGSILLRDRASDFGRIGPVRVTIGTRPQMRRLIRALKPLL
jgi:histidinol-phosphate aminotransferase